MLYIIYISFKVWKAFVVTRLWHWYVVSLFSVRELPLPYAYGLLLLISSCVGVGGLLADGPIWDKKTFSEKVSYVIAVHLVGPGVILLIGWLVTFFT